MTACLEYEEETNYQLLSSYNEPLSKTEAIVQPERIDYLRTRAIDLNLSELERMSKAENDLGRMSVLQFFPNASFPVIFNEPIWHKPDSYSLIGKVLGEENSEVNLTVTGKIIRLILKSQNGVYIIRHNGSFHEVYQLDEEYNPITFAFNNDENQSLENEKSVLEETETLSEANSVSTEIDVLFVYSTAAKVGAGGEENIRNLIYSGVVLTNQSFENSLIDLSIYPIHITETSFEPESYSEGLYCISEKNDDCLENIHLLRDQYYADLVVYVINDNSYCGLAWHIKEFNDYSSQNGFSLVNWRCLGSGQYALAREIGKNLGAQTNRESAEYEKGVFPYSFGYQTTSQTYRSIMAMDCVTQSCTRINYWSSPYILADGEPLGVHDYADNRRSIGEIAPIVSGFRNPPSPPSAPTLLTPSNLSEHASYPLLYGWVPQETATQYEVVIRKFSTNELIHDEIISAGQICTDTLCAYPPNLSLNGDDYIWYVAGINSIGTGSFGDGSIFFIQFDPPILENPVNDETIYSTKPTFQWQQIQEATTYNFQLFTIQGVSVLTTALVSEDICQNQTCTFSLNSDIPIGDYQWRVSGVKTITGKWSEYNTFTIDPLGIPDLLTPTDNSVAFNYTPTFHWTTATNATGYELQYTLEDDSFTNPIENVLSETTFEPSADLELGQWFWRVRSTYGETRGDWSNVQTFSLLENPYWTNEFGHTDGWIDPTSPRTVADVNGDGINDLIGFSPQEVIVALGNGSGFETGQQWIAAYGSDESAGGWDGANSIRTLADVNGDGMDDIVGFGNYGVLVSLSTGAHFENPQYWNSGYGSSTASGNWSTIDHVRVVSDVNGDGMADVVGFGDTGVQVSLSTGNGFQPASYWAMGFGNILGGWDGIQHPRTLADVNGDGCGDIVGFSNWGVLVALSNACSGQHSFALPTYWIYGFAYELGGWDSTRHIRTLADVDGDGDDDLIGFGDWGVLVSVSTGDGFDTPNYWTMGYGYNIGGWRVNEHPRFVRDVNGDSFGDVVAFADNGVIVLLSDRTKFE